MRRLQSDHIDLYQLHSPPREELTGSRLQDALGLLARLKTEGKIREYGIALDFVYDAVHCLDMEGLASLQMPFGLMDLQALDGVFDKVSERQLGIIARGCFGGGALKQSLTEAELRASEPQWERALQIKRLAEQMQRSALEAALQFALSIERISVTILGMRTPEHVATNLQYYAAKPLSDEESANCWPADAQHAYHRLASERLKHRCPAARQLRISLQPKILQEIQNEGFSRRSHAQLSPDLRRFAPRPYRQRRRCDLGALR